MSAQARQHPGVKARPAPVAAAVHASAVPRFDPPTVVIASRQRTRKVDARLLKQIALELLVELGIEQAELGIHLVGAREMARVNWRYLRHKGSTDVITFDHAAADCGGRSREFRLYGEMFICVDDAVKQAVEFQTTWGSEIVRYVVHGVLHLTGHDDLKPGLRRKMKREENRLMRRLDGTFAISEL
ncbi:MAG: rRNA maturation RNase YbeY [Verrucomicrobiota bacterium]|jgi:probable rRNA maturation factor